MLYDAFLVGSSYLSIHLIGTIPERLFIFSFIGIFLYWLGKRLAALKKNKLVSAIVAGVVTLSYSIYLRSTIVVFFHILFALIVLILYLLIVRLPFTKKRKFVSAVAAGIMTFFISSIDLTDLHRSLFADQAVTKFAQGQYNTMGMDTDNHILYAIGNKINRVHAYKTDALNASPEISEVETGGAETAFFYNPGAKEVYNYNEQTQRLNILDSKTLTLKESVPFQLAPGGSWIEYDPHTDYIIVVSEGSKSKGDLEHDISLVLINRTDRKIVKELNLHAPNILLHPTRPLLYLSQFRSARNEIIVYDLESLEISRRTLINARMDRMAHLESVNELLVTIPTKSLIYRLDADTLALKGEIKSSFGVRTLAVDAKRNLLLTLSLVTNIMDVIDLNTYQSINKYYLAPWLRSIILDGNGTAYVSSFTGLFRVQYAGHGERVH